MDLDLLIHRFRGPLTGLLVSWGNDRQRAVEIAQDTFAEAWFCRANFRGSFEDLAVVGPWLRGIARNLHRRQLRTMRGPARGSTSTSLDDLPEDRLAAAPDAQPTEAQLALEQALSRLKLPWRTVLTMRYLEGSGLPEIAAVMDLSVRAVEGLLHRARRELRAILPLAAETHSGRAAPMAEEIAR